MKSTLALLLPLLSVALAAPSTASGPASELELPRRWTRIASADVRQRMPSRVSGESAALDKREPGNVYLCTEPNFEGECAVVDFTIDYVCKSIPEPFTYNLGSIAPEKGALCRLMTTGNSETCNLHGDLSIESPGYEDLFDHDGEDYGTQAHHIMCQECTACQGEE